MSFRILPPQSSADDLDALEAVCRQLAGFDDTLNFERVDGFLTGLAAGPRLPDVEQWLAALCGDTFDRVHADPGSHAAGLRPLQRRLKVLCAQLDPETLMQSPDDLRLDPMVAEWTDAERQRWIDEDGATAEEAALGQTGAEWALGFMQAVAAFDTLWTPPEDEALAEGVAFSLASIRALTWAPGDPALVAHLQSHYPDASSPDQPGQPDRPDHETPAVPAGPDREALLIDACLAAQDLRMIWVDAVPRGETVRAAPVPGRNDPCFCGSGKKYKKCHGAAA